MKELNVFLKVSQEFTVNNAFKGNGNHSALKASDLTIFTSDHISTVHHYKNVFFEACVLCLPSIHHKYPLCESTLCHCAHIFLSKI